MRKRQFMVLVAGAIVIAGCGRSGEAPVNVHDTKYRLAGDSAETPGTANGACVLDTMTGLLWEVKETEAGLRSAQNTYSWYNPEQEHDELDYRGTSNGGDCSSSDCDTWEFVITVNQAGLCGYHDWRIPSRDELFSISDRSRPAPTVNAEFFPHTHAAEYWSGNDYSFQPDSAWVWNFEFGHDRVDWKKTPKYVRLVRGESEDLMPVKE